jgi:hypothetical protein
VAGFCNHGNRLSNYQPFKEDPAIIHFKAVLLSEIYNTYLNFQIDLMFQTFNCVTNLKLSITSDRKPLGLFCDFISIEST